MTIELLDRDLALPGSNAYHQQMELLLLPDEVKGSERGTNQEADLLRLRETADGADLNAMWREFNRVVAMNNADRSRLVQLLSYRVANDVERVYYPVSEDFEEASEFGEPKGVRLGRPFSMGFDFKWYDLAIRYTWKFLVDATSEELRALTNEALEADNRLVFTRIMKAVFNPANRTADINGAAYNVYALYNGDGTVPPQYKTTTFNNTHTHYLASGAGTVDSGDLDAMEEHLFHHGYRMTNGYQLVLLVNRQEAQVIKTFTVAGGDSYDFIPNGNVGGGVLRSPVQIVGQPSASGIPGEIGTYGPWNVIEEEYIPAGFMVGFATGGEESLGNMIGIREHANTSVRGLQLVKGPDNDYPLTDSFYRHGLGTGIRHRGAGVVMKITAGAYAAPSQYA